MMKTSGIQRKSGPISDLNTQLTEICRNKNTERDFGERSNTDIVHIK